MLISLLIFSVVILALTGLSLSIARRATRSTDQSYIMGTLVSEVDRLTTLPFDSLPANAGCVNSGTWNVTITRCRTITPISIRSDSVRIVVRTTVPASRPDTVQFVRGRVRRPIPLR